VIEILIIAVNAGDWVLLLKPSVLQAIRPQCWNLWLFVLSTSLGLHYFCFHSVPQTSISDELLVDEECWCVQGRKNHDDKEDAMAVDLTATVPLLENVDTEKQPARTDYGSSPIGIERRQGHI
jgi:hypothetical protein